MRLPFGIALRQAVAEEKVPATAAAMTDMAAHDETARTRLAEAQARQEKAANRHRREEAYAVGDQVMLSTKHLAGYQHKLLCRFIGPFTVIDTGTATVTLDLPTDMRVHDRVNVDRVKRYVPSVGEWPGRTQISRPLPVRTAADGVGKYEVEAILGKRETLETPPSSADSKGRKVNRVSVTRYLVQWKGYSMDDCSWERAANLAGAANIVLDRAAVGASRPSVMVLWCEGSQRYHCVDLESWNANPGLRHLFCGLVAFISTNAVQMRSSSNRTLRSPLYSHLPSVCFTRMYGTSTVS